METEQQLLENTLKTRNPILFLGAGFSKGAVCGKKEIPLGDELRKNILKTLFNSKRIDQLKLDDEDLKEIESYSLAELCEYINSEGEESQAKLVDYIVKEFKGTYPNKKDPFHKLLPEYRWKKIYTLNVDDLVENVYQQAGKPLLVQNDLIRKSFNENSTQLIKIHGCVKKPELGFIFGKDEYRDSIDQENFKLRSFAQDFFDSDVIFVGTEFNEDDILALITKYRKSGSRSNARRYYFIAPTIKPKLKNMIKSNENFYYIGWTAKTFLEKCTQIISDADKLKEKERILKDYYFQNIEESMNVKKYYTSELYYGRYSTWSDFVEEWDIPLPEQDKCIDWIDETGEQKVITIVGGSYVGKTVFARRILFELYKKGYLAYEFNFKGAMEFELLKDYIKLIPDRSNIALLVEDAAMQYKHLADYMKNKPDNVEKLVFILVSKPYYHDMKKYELTDIPHKEIYLKLQMNYNIANNILEKLKDKNRIGELNKYGSDDRERFAFIKSKLSIIDALYSVTHGRGFEDFFSDCYEKLEVKEDDKNLFEEICLLYAMGFEDYPPKLQSKLKKTFSMEKFLKKFEDIVVEDDNGNLKVRCAEMFENRMIRELSSIDKKNILLKYFGMFAGLFAEGEENEWNMYFEKLLKLDALIERAKLNINDIGEIFIELEDKYRQISYYWMQRGLYEQKKDQFENANTFLNNAQEIQKNSYQIRHALAKNELAWAVYEMKNSYYASASYHYDKGEAEFWELITSPKYTKAKGYSVHSYINLKIDYYTLLEKKIEQNELEDMYELLIQTSSTDDKAINQAVQKVYAYCKKRGISSDIAEKFEEKNFKKSRDFQQNMQCIHRLGDYL